MSDTYVVVRTMFYLNEKDVVKVVARQKNPDGNALIRTITRGLEDIQFWVPYLLLNNQSYFVAIHDDLFPDVSNPGSKDTTQGEHQTKTKAGEEQ